MRGQAGGGVDEERVEGVVVGGGEGLERTAHARVPEGLDVPRDGLDRLGSRQVRELTGDVVAHACFGGMAHAWVSAGWRAWATEWSPRALATPTCTAVTLYSGQLVAQSEFSVVTTLAPVTGWWKVV